MPCNTAHAFYDEIASELSVPLVNMVEETAAFISRAYPATQKIGLLATEGTVRSRVYHRVFESAGIEVTDITPALQRQVTGAIYGKTGIKAGGTTGPAMLLKPAFNFLKAAGVDMVVLACTELPLVVNTQSAGVPCIDTTEVLAQALLREASQTVEVASYAESSLAAG